MRDVDLCSNTASSGARAKGQARSRLSIWDLGFRSAAGPAQPPGLYVCSSCLLSVNICLLLSASKPRPQVLTMSRLTHCQNLSTIATFSLAMIRCASATRTGDEDLALGCHAKRDSDADLIIRAHLRPWNRLPLNDDGFVHLTWSSLSMSARYTTHTHIDSFYVRPPPIPRHCLLHIISDIRYRAPQVLLRGEVVHTSRTCVSRTRIVWSLPSLSRHTGVANFWRRTTRLEHCTFIPFTDLEWDGVAA